MTPKKVFSAFVLVAGLVVSGAAQAQFGGLPISTITFPTEDGSSDRAKAPKK